MELSTKHEQIYFQMVQVTNCFTEALLQLLDITTITNTKAFKAFLYLIRICKNKKYVSTASLSCSFYISNFQYDFQRFLLQFVLLCLFTSGSNIVLVLMNVQ